MFVVELSYFEIYLYLIHFNEACYFVKSMKRVMPNKQIDAF